MDFFFLEAAQSGPDASQIIGMIIALVAVLYTVITTAREIFSHKKVDQRKKQSAQEFLKEYLGTMKQEDEDDEEEEDESEYAHPQPLPPPPPPLEIKGPTPWRRPEEKFKFQTKLDNFRPKTAIEVRNLHISSVRPGDELVNASLSELQGGSLESHKKEKGVHRLFAHLTPKKMLIVAHELIKPPVGMR